MLLSVFAFLFGVVFAADVAVNNTNQASSSHVRNTPTYSRRPNHFLRLLSAPKNLIFCPRGDPQESREVSIGSEFKYVTDVRFCSRLKRQYKKMKKLTTMYVTDLVFAACQFNSTSFPHLKVINIDVATTLDSLLRNENFVNIRDASMDEANPFKLKKLVIHLKESCVETQVIRKGLDQWLPFLLKYRDWDDASGPFVYWDWLLENAVDYGRLDMITQLFEFGRTRSFHLLQAPFALERAIKLNNHEILDRFRPHVNQLLMNGLIAVESGDVYCIRQLLSENPSAQTVSRLLSFRLEVEDFGENRMPSNNDILDILANHPRLDLDFESGASGDLFLRVFYKRQWATLMALLSRGGITRKLPELFNKDILEYAIIYKAPSLHFRKLLSLGANTFYRGSKKRTPLAFALDEGFYKYANFILKHRIVKSDPGVSELLLTEEERDYIQNFESAQDMLQEYKVRIVE